MNLKKLLSEIKRLNDSQKDNTISNDRKTDNLIKLQGIKETWESNRYLRDDCFRYGGGNTKSYKLCEKIDEELL